MQNNSENTNDKIQEYSEFVKKVTPKKNLPLQMGKAFIMGGIICTVGQIIINVGKNVIGLSRDEASMWCSVILVFLSALFTGFGWYSKIANFGGAGALVPITGFANSVAAPAIEYRKEGQVYGIGAKIFTIAGPVILYGILGSWIVGLIYWFYKLLW